ncbi:hypothetical protein E3N88_05658 [Mikania micrantha]|uniref:Acyl-ACP thioesterase-like C-terminal domain-containing protein n=1 Tax=Mikania micrantha TaxID=192012 RepID=A0A5N6PMA7_9ASTR|nr:hypothetical protein E3N88_05658 [Mikania micrantha]
MLGKLHLGKLPRWSDLDINQHVNNVKYIGWILESVPETIMKNYELASMTLEYCRECRKNSVLQSRTFVIGIDSGNIANCDHIDCEHLLQLEIGGDSGEIMKEHGYMSGCRHYQRSRCDGRSIYPDIG